MLAVCRATPSPGAARRSLLTLCCYLLLAAWNVLSSTAAAIDLYATLPLGVDYHTLAPRGKKEKPVLERDVGAVKGYTVLIIVLSGLLVILVIAWFYYLVYSKRAKK